MRIGIKRGAKNKMKIKGQRKSDIKVDSSGEWGYEKVKGKRKG